MYPVGARRTYRRFRARQLVTRKETFYLDHSQRGPVSLAAAAPGTYDDTTAYVGYVWQNLLVTNTRVGAPGPGINQGTAFNNRLGRFITVKSISIHWQCLQDVILPDDGGGDMTNRQWSMRLLVYRDKEPEVGTHTYAQVFDSSIVAGAMNPKDYRNLDYAKRFVIMYDKTVNMRLGMNGPVSGKIFIKRPFSVQYTRASTTGLNATFERNSIFFLVVPTLNIVPAGGSPQFTWGGRIRFDP